MTKNNTADYGSYVQWKQWGAHDVEKEWLDRYFSKEIDRAGLGRFESVLEAGFGNGEFLSWARSQGAAVTGVDIMPEVVSLARDKGFEVYTWDISEAEKQANPLVGRRFDCIVAFDVIEHLDVEQATRALANLADMLCTDGKLILRFPNGESPFSTMIFNNDCTHKTWFTRRKLEHVCIGTPLIVDRYENTARVINRNRLFLLKWICFLLRNLCEMLVGYVYYGHRVPLDQCATAVLRRAD